MVGIDDPDASSFAMNISPNPISENSVLNIHQLMNSDVTIQVVDMQGRVNEVVYRGKLSEGDHQFNLGSLMNQPAGLYLLIMDDGVTIQRQKLVVQ